MCVKLLGEKACYNRLNAFFMEHYGEYEDTAEWYPDNTMNRWTCDIREIGITVQLLVDRRTGLVSEIITEI